MFAWKCLPSQAGRIEVWQNLCSGLYAFLLHAKSISSLQPFTSPHLGFNPLLPFPQYTLPSTLKNIPQCTVFSTLHHALLTKFSFREPFPQTHHTVQATRFLAAHLPSLSSFFTQATLGDGVQCAWTSPSAEGAAKAGGAVPATGPGRASAGLAGF